MALSRETLERRQAGCRAEIVDRILPLIEDLLAEESSYLELPLERIISRAQMSRTTFYRHFEDKNHLLAALCEPVLRDMRDASMEAWRLPPDATRSELENALRRSWLAYRPHMRLLEAMFEVATYSPEMRQQLQGMFGSLRDIVAEHLAGGQRAGFVRAGLRTQDLAGWITWMAERGLQHLVVSAGAQDADRLVESLSDVIWYTAFEGQGRRDDVGR